MQLAGQSDGKLQVRCSDGNGRPVAKANVWIWQYRSLPDDSGQMVPAGPFVTGVDGSVATVVPTTFKGRRFDRWVYACIDGKLVGATRSATFSGAKPEDGISVTLLPSTSLKGRVSVPEGVDPTTVTVRTLALNGAIDQNWFAQMFPRQSSIESLRGTLPSAFDTRIAADGTFRFDNLPNRPLIYLAAEGPGLGQAQWFNALLPERKIPDLVKLVMEPEASYAGRLLDASGKPVAKCPIRLQVTDGPDGFGVRCSFRTSTDDTGAFELRGLPGGGFDLHVDALVGVMWPEAVSLRKGSADGDNELRLERGTEVRGVVIDDNGKLLEDAHVSAITGDERRIRLDHSATDQLGRFVLRLPSGNVDLYFSGVPKGYEYPKPQIIDTLEIEAGSPPRKGLEFVLRKKD